MLNISAAYNMSMMGFENNPKTMYASADMPFRLFGVFHGVGLRFVNDQIGLFSHNSIALQYALKLKLFGGQLSIGLQGALLGEKLDGSKLDLEEPTDPAFTKAETSGSGFDLGVGLYYQMKNWYAGFSVQHAMEPTVDLGETGELNVARTYYFMAGGNIRLRNPFLSIQPSVLGRYDGAAYRGDITTRLTYASEKKMLYVGVGYSPTNSVSAYLGGTIHGVSLGYSYEAYTNGLKLGNGSHELMIGYQMKMNFTKKGRNRHQSVRIL
jgi:type IX secretion system PorP/SprF family membrane protein